jgi:hypothetical protein
MTHQQLEREVLRLKGVITIIHMFNELPHLNWVKVLRTLVAPPIFRRNTNLLLNDNIRTRRIQPLHLHMPGPINNMFLALIIKCHTR